MNPKIREFARRVENLPGINNFFKTRGYLQNVLLSLGKRDEDIPQKKKYYEEYQINSLLKRAIDLRADAFSNFEIITEDPKIQESLNRFASTLLFRKDETGIDPFIANSAIKKLIRDISVYDDITGMVVCWIKRNNNYNYINVLPYWNFEYSEKLNQNGIPQEIIIKPTDDYIGYDIYKPSTADKLIPRVKIEQCLWYSSNGRIGELNPISNTESAIRAAFYYREIQKDQANSVRNFARAPIIVSIGGNQFKYDIPKRITEETKKEIEETLRKVSEGKSIGLFADSEVTYKRLEAYSLAQMRNFALDYISGVANAFKMPKELLNTDMRDVSKCLVYALSCWYQTEVITERKSIEAFIRQVINKVLLLDGIHSNNYSIKWTTPTATQLKD